MKISVIIPAFNEAEHIQRSVSSAWAAGAHDVLVVDGGSEDQTLNLAAEAGATTLSSPVPGRGGQQRYAAENADGDLLVFLHADSFFADKAFVPLIDHIAPVAAGPWPDVSPYGAWGGFTQRITAAGWAYRGLEYGNQFRARWIGWIYGDQALWVSAQLLREIGGVPSEPLMEDLILSRKLGRIARPWLCPSFVHTSPRRWQRDGIFRRTCLNWWLLAQYFSGRSPQVLAEQYRTRPERSHNAVGRANSPG